MFERILGFQARQNPDAAAIWSDGAEITFGKLERNVGRVTAALALEQLAPRSVVVLNISNVPLLWLCTLALERLGHATVCVRSNLDAQIEQIQPQAVVTTNPDLACASGVRVITITAAWRSRAFSLAPIERRSIASPDDLVRIVLSSGTTGVKKQIRMTRRVVDDRIGVAAQIGAPSRLRFLATMGPDTSSGFNRPLSTWGVGGTIIFAGSITEQLLREGRPNLTSISPILLKAALPALSKVYTAENRIRIVVGGSAMPVPLIRAGLECPGLELLISYGSTEAGTVAYGPARLAMEQPGAVGYITPWARVEVVEADGQPAAPGRTGEIRIKGAGDEARAPDESAHPTFRDGWFYPNDIGRLGEDGVLVIEGRSDDVINIGGAKYSAARVEDVVLGCEGVEDAAVTAFPMASGQWRAFAALVTKEGYLEQDVIAKVEQAFGFIPFVVQLQRIERNAMGKIVRARVREDIIAHQNNKALAAAPGSP